MKPQAQLTDDDMNRSPQSQTIRSKAKTAAFKSRMLKILVENQNQNQVVHDDFDPEGIVTELIVT